MTTMTTVTQSIPNLAKRLQEAGAQLISVESRASDSPASIPLSDVSTAVVDALANPVDFPPLAQATVPGDQVALAVDEGIPCLAEVVVGAIEGLRQAGVEIDATSVAMADRRAAAHLQERLAEVGLSAVNVVLHDPDDRDQLCFVGTTRAEQTLLMNRTLYDADLVLPIGCTRLDSVLGAAGVYDCLFPRFSDGETIRRWRSSRSLTQGAKAGAQQQADEAGWLLGAPLVVQVIPGPQASIADILAGEARAVARQASQSCATVWSKSVAHRASLVIATLTGSPDDQTWDNVARAAHTATSVLQQGGALAICGRFQNPPGESLRRLADAAEEFDLVEQQALRDAKEDSWSAWQFAQVLQQGPVYLLSGLDPEVVEDLNLSPVDDIDELARLASRHESCIVLHDAHHVVACVEGECDQ